MKIIKGLVYTDKQYIELLEKRLNKAIEYISSNTFIFPNGDVECDIDHNDLIKILKGEENDN